MHYTHYGRGCPIETPEGPNIGLIVSLASHARINEFGLIESPYRKVVKGKLGDVEYLNADAESGQIVAQANTPIDKDRIATDSVAARSRGDLPASTFSNSGFSAPCFSIQNDNESASFVVSKSS